MPEMMRVNGALLWTVEDVKGHDALRYRSKEGTKNADDYLGCSGCSPENL